MKIILTTLQLIPVGTWGVLGGFRILLNHTSWTMYIALESFASIWEFHLDISIHLILKSPPLSPVAPVKQLLPFFLLSKIF